MAVYAPIWKDTYFTINNLTYGYNSFYYRIMYPMAQNIFTGRVYAYSQWPVEINVNKICSQYLSSNIDAILAGGTAATATNAVGTFTVTASGVGSTWVPTSSETYTFLYCWDYDFDWSGETVVLSQPICDTYGEGMMTLTTTASTSSVITTAGTPAKKAPCVDYGLYYCNARGGWDAFAIQGAVRKTDNITEFTTDRSFNNNTKEFESQRYMTEIKTAYELHTHYLTDEQSENLAKNLLGSNKVYLHNLKNGTIKPVLITDKSVKYLQQGTNNNKMAQYTINVVESQSRLRR